MSDLLDPTRTGSATDLVNAVSRDVGRDVAAWSILRLTNAAAQMAREARERERQQQGGR